MRYVKFNSLGKFTVGRTRSKFINFQFENQHISNRKSNYTTN